MAAQLWGLNHGVQAALDCLVVCPCNKRKSLWLGQRRMEQLQKTGWLRTVKGTKVSRMACAENGTVVPDGFIDKFLAPSHWLSSACLPQLPWS